MYTFTRSMRLITGVSGPGYLASPMTWIRGLTEKANEITAGIGEDPFYLWSSTYSSGNGVLLWTKNVTSWGRLEVVDDALGENEGFLSTVGEGVNYTSDEAAQDSLVRILHSPADLASDISGAHFATIWQASAVAENITQAVEVGAEIAERASAEGGSPTSFGVTITGALGTFEWKSYHDSHDSLENSQEALDAAHPAFLSLGGQKAGASFISGSVSRRILRKARWQRPAA